MPAIPSSPNLLLRALPEAELEALGQRLELVELVEETILVEAGRPRAHIYLPYSGAISIMARLSGGQTVEVATIGRDSIFGAAAALDGGQSLTSAFVVLPCPARPRCSTLRIFGQPSTEASLSAQRWRDTSRHCSQWPSNPLHAMHRTRSKYVCHAGCCVHAIYAAAKGCRLLRKPWHS